MKNRLQTAREGSNIIGMGGNMNQKSAAAGFVFKAAHASMQSSRQTVSVSKLRINPGVNLLSKSRGLINLLPPASFLVVA